MIVYDAHQQRLELAETVGHGGEAVVYRIAGQPDLLAKIYTPEPRANYPGKLDWMVNHTPENPTRAFGHASLAWPGGLLFDSHRRLKGYWMPFIRHTVPMLEVFNPRRRVEVLPQFDRRYLLRTARNLAAALSALHRSGYVAGDLNESNVLVTPTALVTLIDTDSFQVHEERSGVTVIHPCPVGKPEYTPPELQRKDLAEVVRQPDHDAFGLAVLIFQLLMEGSHPFRAQWLAAGDPPPLEVRIANGAFPYVDAPAYPVLPPKNALGIETLHPWLVELFRRGFVEGHRDPRYRPGPDLWVRALNEAERAQVLCSAGHYYSSHLKTCPYCALAEKRTAAAQAAKQPQAGRPAPKEQASVKPPQPAWAAPASSVSQPAAARTFTRRAGSRYSTPVAARARAMGIHIKSAPGGAASSSASSAGAAAASFPSAGSWGFSVPRAGMGGVLRSRSPVITPVSVGIWARQLLYQSLSVGGGQGALAGAVPGMVLGVLNWSAGEALYWTLLFSLGGAAGGLLRGWRPGHKLASVIDRFIGWQHFWQGLGLLAGALLGGALGMLFAWAIFPVILGLVLGAQGGVLLGRKIWQAGSMVGWERIWGTISALGFGAIGFGIAHLAGLLGMNALGTDLANWLLPYASNDSYIWAFIWVLAGGLGGALAGALGGIFTDFIGRVTRLVN